MCLNLAINIVESRYIVFVVNFEHILHFFLAFLLVTLNR